MSDNLTGQKRKNTYNQLLNVDGGIDASLKSVASGVGTDTALKLSTDAASIDNLKFDGNTISSTDTNGNINLSPHGSGAVVVSNITITGGSISGITDLPVADGGTGASTAAAARTNLGLGTIATQDSNNVTISGGTITGSYIAFTALGAATVQATGSLGYATGAGGTQTQGTSKSTGVTLDKISGQITMHNATLNAGTSVSFTLTNSTILSTDAVIVNIASGATTNAYTITVDAVATGSCRIHLRNESAGNLGEALVLNFIILRGVTS